MPGRKAPEEERREMILRATLDVAGRQGIEALTVRAVAERAGVSHGTVLFHFDRRDQLVAALLERVLDTVFAVRGPDGVERDSRPTVTLLALLRLEMQRLSTEPRHFRLFLEFWTLGVRNAAFRRRVGAALERYREGFRDVAQAVVDDRPRSSRGRDKAGVPDGPTRDGLAAVAVSLVHGCALQAVIEPKRFDIEQHFATAAQLLELGG